MWLKLPTGEQQSPSQGVPLIVWGYTTILAAVMAAGLLTLSTLETAPSAAFAAHNTERIAAWQRRLAATGAVGVVVLGDSRVRYAVMDEPELSRRLTERYGAPVEALRITNNWAVFEDFAPLAESILAAGPALVLVQQDLLVKARTSAWKLLLGREYVVWRVFGRGLWDPMGHDQNALQDEMRCEALVHDDGLARRERMPLWVRRDDEGASQRLVQEFAAAAGRRGARVRYFAVPITTTGRVELPSFVPEATDASLAAPIAIPDDDYCDLVHMNPAGRRTYTTWLVGEAAELLPGGSGRAR